MQGPGVPNEDNFDLGGWMWAFNDDGMDFAAAGFFGIEHDLVLELKTYEIFTSYWPLQAASNPFATTLNADKKYEASHMLKSLQWNNSAVLQGEVVAAIQTRKQQPCFDLLIIGSGNLIQTLHNASLIDEYHIWTFPVVLGRGKRLFEQGAMPCALRLIESRVSKTGALMNTFVPEGELKLGTVGEG